MGIIIFFPPKIATGTTVRIIGWGIMESYCLSEKLATSNQLLQGIKAINTDGQLQLRNRLLCLNIIIYQVCLDFMGFHSPVGASHDLTISIRNFLSFLCPSRGVAQFQTRPLPYIILCFSLPLLSLPPPLYSAPKDCLNKPWESCDMSILPR